MEELVTLPDYLGMGLDIVFVGLNPSLPSVAVGHYFANPRNRFWPAFNRSDLVARELTPERDGSLLADGIGFTDVVKRPTAMGSGLKAADYRFWSPVLKEKLLKYQPRIACFHGVHQYPGKGQTTPDKLYRFIENFQSNVIICAHWGGGLPFYALMPEVPQVLENVYFDTAASPFLYRPDVFTAVTGLVGADKILFATDYPLIRARRLLGQVEEAGLSLADQDSILSGNAARLLGL